MQEANRTVNSLISFVNIQNKFFNFKLLLFFNKKKILGNIYDCKFIKLMNILSYDLRIRMSLDFDLIVW